MHIGTPGLTPTDDHPDFDAFALPALLRKLSLSNSVDLLGAITKRVLEGPDSLRQIWSTDMLEAFKEAIGQITCTTTALQGAAAAFEKEEKNNNAAALRGFLYVFASTGVRPATGDTVQELLRLLSYSN